MPVNAIALPFSFAAAIDSSSLIDPPRLETGIKLAICDSLSLATVVLLNNLGASALESQNRKPDTGREFSALFQCTGVSDEWLSHLTSSALRQGGPHGRHIIATTVRSW
jgi:hypothetical protein